MKKYFKFIGYTYIWIFILLRPIKRKISNSKIGKFLKKIKYIESLPVYIGMTSIILGILYIVVFYLSYGMYPFNIGDWNILIGILMIFIGLISFTFWK